MLYRLLTALVLCFSCVGLTIANPPTVSLQVLNPVFDTYWEDSSIPVTIQVISKLDDYPNGDKRGAVTMLEKFDIVQNKWVPLNSWFFQYTKTQFFYIQPNAGLLPVGSYRIYAVSLDPVYYSEKKSFSVIKTELETTIP